MTHYDLNHFVRELEAHLPAAQDQMQAVQTVAGAMQKLLSNDQLFSADFVRALREGQTDGQVYHSPNLDFIVQVFGWNPGSETPIHDHETWGVMGIYAAELEIREYDLKPTGQAGQFDLDQKAHYRAGRGAISYIVTPQDEIHHISNPGSEYALSIHVYGNPIGSYHQFDLENGRITRVG
jgi:3-mercaptopropionate dioxygenase